MKCYRMVSIIITAAVVEVVSCDKHPPVVEPAWYSNFTSFQEVILLLYRVRNLKQSTIRVEIPPGVKPRAVGRVKSQHTSIPQAVDDVNINYTPLTRLCSAN